MAKLKKKTLGAEPEMKDLLDLFKKDVMLSINCHAIATVQSFNSVNQTVTATVNYKKTKFVFNKKTREYDPTSVNYPLIIDCPAVILSGGASRLNVPIAKGDECLILFNDRDLDNWFAGNSNAPVNSTRLHSFADAIALVGVRSSARKIPGYDMNHLAMVWGNAKVGVSSSKAIITNGTSLGSILQDLLTTLIALTVNTGTGVPNPTWSTDLNTVKTKLAALLE